MSRLFSILSFLFSFLLGAGGCIKGSTNPVVDEVIKDVEAFYPDDNVVEQAIEKKIEDYTGLEVDLTPDTPEPTPSQRAAAKAAMGANENVPGAPAK